MAADFLAPNGNFSILHLNLLSDILLLKTSDLR